MNDNFDIHSDSTPKIRRTVIVMSVILLSLDYRNFSLPETISVSEITISKITSWHIYATIIALLFYQLLKYIAKLRELYSQSNNHLIPRTDYLINLEKSKLEKYFNSQLLSYVNKTQLGLENVRTAYKSRCEQGEILRIETIKANGIQKSKEGKYSVIANGLIHFINNNDPYQRIEHIEFGDLIGPISISFWQKLSMKIKAWFWYLFSDHILIDYSPIIIALLALTKFAWLFYQHN